MRFLIASLILTLTILSISQASAGEKRRVYRDHKAGVPLATKYKSTSYRYVKLRRAGRCKKLRPSACLRAAKRQVRDRP